MHIVLNPVFGYQVDNLTSHKFYPQSDMGPALYQVSFDYGKQTVEAFVNGQSLGKTLYHDAPDPRHILRLFANNALNQFPQGFCWRILWSLRRPFPKWISGGVLPGEKMGIAHA